eukprot:m.34335 g.34335  ORF g.34335 m.34335 type:complete len:553 (-) comp10695_c1_seq1:168-1826(-)
MVRKTNSTSFLSRMRSKGKLKRMTNSASDMPTSNRGSADHSNHSKRSSLSHKDFRGPSHAIPSFWEPSQYKRVLHRMDQGASLADDFAKMVHERATIEKKYAAMLDQWATRWGERASSNGELRDGTLLRAQYALLTEAEKTSKAHTAIGKQLKLKVVAEVARWKKDNYAKSIVKFKDTKRAESGFVKAQKPWVKLTRQMGQAQRAYHDNCRQRDSVEKRIRDSEMNSNVKTEEIVKMKERLAKLKGSVQTSKKHYESALKALQADERRYRTDMTAVFDQAQAAEQKRIGFFKEVMQKYREIVIATNENACACMGTSVDAVNAESDLATYDRKFGTGNELAVPRFHEYNATGIVISGVVGGVGGCSVVDDDDGFEAPPNLRPDGSVNALEPPTSDYGTGSSEADTGDWVEDEEDGLLDDEEEEEEYDEDNYGEEEEAEEDEEEYDQLKELAEKAAETGRRLSAISSGARASMDNASNASNATSRRASLLAAQGRPVRALYDYQAEEPEEISFVVGDIVVQLEDEDEQGWCKGVHPDGTVGLYPASYVELVEQL